MRNDRKIFTFKPIKYMMSTKFCECAKKKYAVCNTKDVEADKWLSLLMIT